MNTNPTAQDLATILSSTDALYTALQDAADLNRTLKFVEAVVRMSDAIKARNRINEAVQAIAIRNGNTWTEIRDIADVMSDL
jgi:hypothetical protein